MKHAYQWLLLLHLLPTMAVMAFAPEDVRYYTEEREAYFMLREALAAKIEFSLDEELKTLEAASDDAFQDSLVDVALDFILQAGEMLENLIADVPDLEPVYPEESLDPGLAWRKTNYLYFYGGISRYGGLEDDNDPVFDTTIQIEDPDLVSGGLSWFYSVWKRTGIGLLSIENAASLRHESAENQVKSGLSFDWGKSHTFKCGLELKGMANFPNSPWKDSTNGIQPGFWVGHIWKQGISSTIGVNGALYKHQTFSYLNFVEPRLEVSAYSLPLPWKMRADGNIHLARRGHFSENRKEEDYTRTYARLGISFNPGNRSFRVYLDNSVDAIKRSQVNGNGDQFTAGNGIGLHQRLGAFARVGVFTRVDHSLFVSADSTGGYRYSSRALSLVPEVSIKIGGNNEIDLGYSFRLFHNNDGTPNDTTRISFEDYQQDGLSIRYRFRTSFGDLAISNRYAFREAVKGESISNVDELSNRTGLSLFLRPPQARWSLTFSSDYAGRWHRTGPQPSDILADISLSYHL